MGANASTAVPLYASGEVLDAARLNLTNCGVPVFSGTATRDSSFGGSGEKILAEGQLCYLEDSNALQYYDGAAWQTRNTSAFNFITSGTVTASTSANFDNVFSSTYENYRVILTDITSSGSSANLTLRYRVGGVSNSSAIYQLDGARFYNAGTDNSVGGTNATSGFLCGVGTSAADSSGGLVMDILQPFLAKPTTYLATSHVYNLSPTGMYNWQSVGVSHTTSTSFDGFQLLITTTTVSYKYKIYGYTNS